MTPNLTPSSLDGGGNPGTLARWFSSAWIRWWISEDLGERQFARLKNLVSTVRSCPPAPPFWIQIGRSNSTDLLYLKIPLTPSRACGPGGSTAWLRSLQDRLHRGVACNMVRNLDRHGLILNPW